jgi:hypothetical protein
MIHIEDACSIFEEMRRNNESSSLLGAKFTNIFSNGVIVRPGINTSTQRAWLHESRGDLTSAATHAHGCPTNGSSREAA